ncbi:hypothetical protein PR202_ga00006 [Eleusine coracana subsp. coracana]|uniref:Uncharacterized protein n=1 Tax=Eleusine coracana subsp. coracana TaxID=191504 RepID=A0AAV5B9H8_ELECO|nr:hypothetical protein PR202_ga00006 [Eleusine coracana subsp. coracana]
MGELAGFRRRTQLPLLVLVLAALAAEARFVVEKNSLMVTSPTSLRGRHDSAIGNFGIPQYGGSMAGAVVYPKDNSDACDDFDGKHTFRAKPGAMPTFLLVDRGSECPSPNSSCPIPISLFLCLRGGFDCLFAKKVWNAQNAGASAVLVVDDKDEPLITMDLPREDDEAAKYIQNITIPSALIDKKFGEQLKKAVKDGDMVNVNLDWREAVPHPDDRVEYELWTNSNDECGPKCDMLMNFLKEFKGAAQLLEKGGYNLQFADIMASLCQYNTCDVFTLTTGLDVKKVDKCMGDPNADSDHPLLKLEQDAQIGKGSRGDVTILPTLVVNNRQYRGKLERKAVLKAICAGFEETTEPNVCLSDDIETNECLNDNGGCWQDKVANVTACRDTFRGRVCECPTFNGVQFKGDGYSNCEPAGPGKCLINHGGCWHETRNGKTFSACQESGDGKCKCPEGFRGDGVKKCEVLLLRTLTSLSGKAYLLQPLCSVLSLPSLQSSTTLMSARRKRLANVLSASAEIHGVAMNALAVETFCTSKHDTCISKTAVQAKAAWAAVWGILIVLLVVAAGSYIVYKYRLRICIFLLLFCSLISKSISSIFFLQSYMDSEIRAIMAQYMPLDNQGEVPNHTNDEDRS